MIVKSATEVFREQFWREIQAAHKVKQREEIKKQYDKHNAAVIISLSKQVHRKTSGK